MDLFGNDLPKNDQDLDIGYNGFVRLGFLIDAKKLRFSCATSPENKDQPLTSKIIIEQTIQGRSEPINNKEFLPKGVHERQPFANKIFEGVQLNLYLKEEMKDVRFPHLSPHHLSTWTDKNRKSSTTLYWKIDDRSLFTRLVSLKSANYSMKCIIIFRKNDFEFKKETEKENKIPDHIAISSLFLGAK